MKSTNELIASAKEYINKANAVVIGAGAGLSTAAGFTYSGERFKRYFGDLERLYNYHDMYSGGFYQYPSDEARWAAWSRNIYINRYMKPPMTVYEDLLKLVEDRDYFVITTNVDHCFQKAGVDRDRLFYTQGDYGLFQCSEPCHQKLYSNHSAIRDMVLSQGFEIDDNCGLRIPKNTALTSEIPSVLIPYCPICGKPMTLHLRSDKTFIQNDEWYAAAERYEHFLNKHLTDKTIYLEIGVGYNTPAIIKFPFIKNTFDNKNAVYICLNTEECYIPEEIEDRSIMLCGDGANIIEMLLT